MSDMNVHLTLVSRTTPRRLSGAEIAAMTAERVAAHKARRAEASEPRPLALTERGRRVGLSLCCVAAIVLLVVTHGTYGWAGVAAALVSMAIALVFTWVLRHMAEEG